MRDPDLISHLQSTGHKLVPIDSLPCDHKRLRGRVWRNGVDDPIGDLENGVVYQDWRLAKAVAELNA